MGKTVLYAIDGTPLLWYVDKPLPYRRTTAGFQPPESREIKNGSLGGRGNVGPPDEHRCAEESSEDAIGQELSVEEEDEEEDGE